MGSYIVPSILIVVVWAALYSHSKFVRLKRRIAFIRSYQWPPGLLNQLKHKHPTLKPDDMASVSRGLRQFFIAHLMSGNKFVAMPSRIVDDLWHEFILYTRDYKEFCAKAFGRFMHHTPAVAMGSTDTRSIGAGLRRAWWFACKDENFNPQWPTRLPLLFALDGQLQIPNGFRYDLDCAALEKTGVTGVYCATDFYVDWPETCGD
jgi:hypothetical protein